MIAGYEAPTMEFQGIFDGEGNEWKKVLYIAAKGNEGHGDTLDGTRQTYRIVKALNDGRGWQCAYQNGVLDDVSRQMGTFDYANHPLGQGFHMSMDRDPHEINNNYTPNLTQKFGDWPKNAHQMREIFAKRRASQDEAYKAEQERLDEVVAGNWISY